MLLSSDRVQEVKFKVNEKVKSEISRAIEFHDDAIKDLEIAFCKTTEITRKWIVSQKLAADAFLQLSLQLTHYELHGFPCATYESASTCAYQHGRTETIRPCTKESRILCDLYHGADYNDPETQIKIYRALKSAMKKHNNVSFVLLNEIEMKYSPLLSLSEDFKNVSGLSLRPISGLELFFKVNFKK